VSNPSGAVSLVTPSMIESIRRAQQGAEGFAETIRLFLSFDPRASLGERRRTSDQEPSQYRARLQSLRPLSQRNQNRTINIVRSVAHSCGLRYWRSCAVRYDTPVKPKQSHGYSGFQTATRQFAQQGIVAGSVLTDEAIPRKS
jgi:hypothetical protein